MGNAWLVDEGIVRRIKDELRARGLDGWLLYELHGRDPLAAASIGLEWTTGRSLDLVPAGLMELLRSRGMDPVNSGDLITTFRSVWTEVNVYFGSDRPEVTTPNPQEEVFLLL